MFVKSTHATCGERLQIFPLTLQSWVGRWQTITVPLCQPLTAWLLLPLKAYWFRRAICSLMYPAQPQCRSLVTVSIRRYQTRRSRALSFISQVVAAKWLAPQNLQIRFTGQGAVKRLSVSQTVTCVQPPCGSEVLRIR